MVFLEKLMSSRPDMIKNGLFELDQIGVRPEDLTSFGAQLFNGLARYPLPDARENTTGVLNGWGCAIYVAFLADMMLRGGHFSLEENTRMARGVGINPDDGAEPHHLVQLCQIMGLKTLLTSVHDTLDLFPYFDRGDLVAINVTELNPDRVDKQDGSGHFALGAGINKANGDLLVLNSSFRPDMPGRIVYGTTVMPGIVYQRSGLDTDGVLTRSGTAVHVDENTKWFDHQVVVIGR